MAVDALARALAAGKVPVTAYEMAVQAGYTGTEEQFAQDMGNSGTNAANAAASASAAAASAESVSASAAQIATNTSDISGLKTQLSAVENMGKNMLANADWVIGNIGGNGANTPHTTHLRTNNYMPIGSIKRCAFAFDTGYTANVYLYDANDTVLALKPTADFEVPDNAVTYRVKIRNDGEPVANMDYANHVHMTGYSNIVAEVKNIKESTDVLYKDANFGLYQGVLNSSDGKYNKNTTNRIFSDYFNDYKNLIIYTPAEQQFAIYWYRGRVEDNQSNFISLTKFMSGFHQIGDDIPIPESANLMRFCVKNADDSDITPNDFLGNVKQYIKDSSNSEYMNYDNNVLYQCRDGRVTETVPPDSLYAIQMTAENQYDIIRFSVFRTADNPEDPAERKYVAVHDVYVDLQAVNPDGTPITEVPRLRTADCTLSKLNNYDWGLKYGDKYKGLKVPQLENCVKYATYFGLRVALDIKFGGYEGNMDAYDVENISKILSKYGQQNATLYVITIDQWKNDFKSWCPDISFSLGCNESFLRSNAAWLKAGKTGYNKVYAHRNDPFGAPATEGFREIARKNGIELDISLINSVENIYNVGFASGATLIECHDIPMVKRSVREYARNLVEPVELP